jgi:hypothetical protein
MLQRLCPPVKFIWIRRIELHIKALATPYSEHHSYFLTEDHLEAYVRVAKLCRQHPDIEVKYIFNSFTWNRRYHLGPESRGFVNQGIVLLKALRNVNVRYLNPDLQHPWSYSGSGLLSGAGGKRGAGMHQT